MSGFKIKLNNGVNMSLFDDIDEVAYELEPWATGLSVAGTGALLIPVYGPIINAVAQVPSTVIDGYQTGRSLYKGDMQDAAWNATELGLDLFSAGIGKSMINGLIKSTKPAIRSASSVHISYPRPRARKLMKAHAREELASLRNEGTQYLAKRGVRPSQGKYFKDRLNRYIIQRVNSKHQRNVTLATDAIANDKVFIPFISGTLSNAVQGNHLVNERVEKQTKQEK